MNIATLLAEPAAIRLARIRPSLGAIKLVIKAMAAQAICPRCHGESSRVHSR